MCALNSLKRVDKASKCIYHKLLRSPVNPVHETLFLLLK